MREIIPCYFIAQMDKQPTATSPRNSFARLWPWLVILIVLLFTGFIRFRLLDMPLERDEGEYAYAGQLILQGIPPYELAYNMKLPGTYYAYALGMAIFGQSTAGVHATLIVVNSLTIIFVFLLARKLFGVMAGLVSCASYAVFSVSPSVLGMAAHANHFVVLFAVPATLLLWKAVESNNSKALFFSGLLYGMAFLMKQQGIFFDLFGICFFIGCEIKKRPAPWFDLAKKCFSFGVAMLLPFGLTCLYLFFAGVFPRFWFWTFTYARSYAAEESLQSGIQVLCTYLKDTHILYLEFYILVIAGLLLALRNKTVRKQLIFLTAFSICSGLATATGFYFRRHYFILALPAFAILIGLAITSVQQLLQIKMARNASIIVSLILFAAILGRNIFIQREFFFQASGNQICQTIYRNFPFIESIGIARYIREHSSENDRIAILGSEPQIYFYAQRRSATGYIYTYALMELQPYAAKMQRDMISEIESNKPEYIVLVGCGNSWVIRPSSDLAIFDWFKKYSKEFYEITGIIEMPSTGEAIYLWDNDVKNHQEIAQLSEHYLIVYKRKSATKTVPAQNN
ncbi:MAG TPA: glycosyltransferase family 39 protein [Verrucomicrobiae bacterium]|nr:glycosyltransferase family 39 protein [Verrucomicrobiae bacterium]